MIGYITIGTNDPDASGKFYDAVFSAIGSERKSLNPSRNTCAPKRCGVPFLDGA